MSGPGRSSCDGHRRPVSAVTRAHRTPIPAATPPCKPIEGIQTMTELLTNQPSTVPDPATHPPMTVEPPPPRTAPGAGSPPRGRGGRLVLGPPGDPRWARPALWALLAATAVLYLWNL